MKIHVTLQSINQQVHRSLLLLKAASNRVYIPGKMEEEQACVKALCSLELECRRLVNKLTEVKANRIPNNYVMSR